jgi:hypothetical protein
MLKSRSSSASWSWKTRASHAAFDSTVHQHLLQNLNQQHTIQSDSTRQQNIPEKPLPQSQHRPLRPPVFICSCDGSHISHHISREKRHFLCFFFSCFFFFTESTRTSYQRLYLILPTVLCRYFVVFLERYHSFYPLLLFYRDLTILELRFCFFLYIAFLTSAYFWIYFGWGV